MKQHRIICIPTLTFALLLMFTPSILQAQDKPVFPIDSLITVGYATGNKKNISGSVENQSAGGDSRTCSRTYHTKRNQRTGSFGCRTFAGNYFIDQW